MTRAIMMTPHLSDIDVRSTIQQRNDHVLMTVLACDVQGRGSIHGRLLMMQTKAASREALTDINSERLGLGVRPQP